MKNDRARYLVVLDDMRIEAERFVARPDDLGRGPAIERAEALAAAMAALEEKEHVNKG